MYSSALPSRPVYLDTVEVTGSIPVSPTSRMAWSEAHEAFPTRSFVVSGNLCGSTQAAAGVQTGTTGPAGPSPVSPSPSPPLSSSPSFARLRRAPVARHLAN